MMSFAQWGNALYSGEKSYAVVPNRKKFVGLAAAVLVIGFALVAIMGLNRSIEFTGGSQFDVTRVSDQSESFASRVVADTGLVEGAPKVTRVGSDSVRIQTSSLDSATTAQMRDALAAAYGVDTTSVQSSSIGPSWGSSVTTKAAQSLVIFMALVALLMTVYFRSWRMAASALLALVHDIAVTVGVFAILQVEVSPATVIGFLTILGYSLYDTVVVFDKVRELTTDVYDQKHFTFAEYVNLAVNQTMVRSINTSVVALLPVGAILIIGSVALGPGTLVDISLALFIGMIAGTYSSIFIASPLLVSFQELSNKTREHDAAVAHERGHRHTTDESSPAKAVKVAPIKPGKRLGNENQPQRTKTHRCSVNSAIASPHWCATTWWRSRTFPSRASCSVTSRACSPTVRRSRNSWS